MGPAATVLALLLGLLLLALALSRPLGQVQSLGPRGVLALRGVIGALGLFALLQAWEGRDALGLGARPEPRVWSAGRPAQTPVQQLASTANTAQETARYEPPVEPDAEPAAAPAAVVEPAPAAAPTEPAAADREAAEPSAARSVASAAVPARSAKPAPRQTRAARQDGRVSVCEVTASGGRLQAASGAGGPSGQLRVHNELGEDQRRERVEVLVDGRRVAVLELGPERRRLSRSLPLGQGGEYELRGYTEYRDGERVPLSGRGWLDPSWTAVQVRTLAPGDRSGWLLLEPAT
ncbi:MAG TPA: hypothetical protein VFV27_02805 [Nevskiaceae bacterium]|nr:hypothetical protein [Nevskiaceae bacterium]